VRTYYTFDDVQLTYPDYSDILSRKDCSTKARLTPKISIDVPIISAPMDTVTGYEMCVAMAELGGIGCLHRFMSIEEEAVIVKKFYNETFFPFEPSIVPDTIHNKHLIASVGVTKEWWERTQAVIAAGAKVLCLDVAHGHHIYVKNALEKIKSEYTDVEVIAGNIATEQAAAHLINWGADCLRVGIGGGSMCETRVRTGVGVPMITCLQDVEKVANTYDIPFIADGGIRQIQDVCKALSMADTVMLGSLLAGTKESPGDVSSEGEWPDEIKYKKYRGSASSESKLSRGEENKHIEGASSRILYKGKVKRIIHDLNDGIISSMSYHGARTLEEFRRKAELGIQTSAGVAEAKPHGLLKGR
jgi:IMP dehydrogenase